MLISAIASSFTAAIAAPAAADDYWYQNRTPGVRSGESVTVETALQVDAFFACLRVITETMGYVPWFVYKRRADGGKERAPEHPLYSKLHDQPNKWQTAFEWKEMMVGHIILRGHAYSRIVPGPSGPFDQFLPLHPDRVKQELLPSGVIRYRYRREDGTEEILTYDEVFHIPGLWGGQSILAAARENLGEALAAQNVSASTFRNRITPPGALKYPGKFKDEAAAARLRAGFQDAYGGSENGGKVLILEEGMEWQQLGMTNEDAQFLQTRQNSVVSIARRFRIPLVLIQEQEKTSSWGSAVEQFGLFFVIHCMLPWFGRFEQRASADLLVDNKTYFTEFLVDSLLRGDAKTRAEALQIARINGAINGNEWRLVENRNPVPDGEMFWRPGNMVPANAPAPQQAPSGPNSNAARFATLLAGQIVRKESERLKALAKRFADDGIAWEAKVREFYDELSAETVERLHLPSEQVASYMTSSCADVLGKGIATIDGWEDRKIQAFAALMEASS
jgi:HK97 family phage portal protein